MAHKNNSIGGCRACEARRALPEALVQGGFAAAEGAKAVHRGFLSRFQGGLAAAEGGRDAAVSCVCLSRGRSELFPNRATAGKPGCIWGRFCGFREILSHFTAKRLTTPICRDRICSEVSYRKGMTSVSKNI